MNITRHVMWAIGLMIASIAVAQEAPKVNLQLTMQTKVNPQGLALWDITNNAQDDKGNLDPKKLTAAKWAKLVEIGGSLEEAGKTLAIAKGVIAAAPGTKLQDETTPDSPKAADVQRHIDAKPGVFRQRAQELQKTGADVVAAAKSRDAKKLGDLSDSLDGVCEACHQTFWYPEQKK
jgi:Cytochrome C'